MIGLGSALLALAGLLTINPARLIAQIEGDRGIAPVAATSDIIITGIEVNTAGKSPQEAREAGWAEARKQAWAKLGGPQMSDNQILALVSAIVVEHEQLGPHRYVARLTVLFDRSRAGQYVGTGEGVVATHSAPMLTIPVLYSGGAAQVYEVRGPWQAAWARFNPSTSGIDYIRPSGAGGDSLLLNAGQVSRRSRSWWATILSQFGASDILVPEARLERQWPGGPVRGAFTARYGPDQLLIGRFVLTAPNDEGLPAMLDAAVKRIDGLYTEALQRGLLRPDPSLRVQNQADPQLVAIIAAAAQAEGQSTGAGAVAPGASQSVAASPAATEARVSLITVQFASPDARAVDAAIGAVRGVPGVRSVATSSLAMGGTSVMRVSYAGSLDELRDALRSRGWSVTAGSNALSIRR
ncbi:MAG: hypothetical protein RLZZ136_1556 [Pseudomonadota bacterium]